MALATMANGTKFDFEPEGAGNVRIITPEGSSVAVDFCDVRQFIALCWAIPQRDARNQRKKWEDVLLGE